MIEFEAVSKTFRDGTTAVDNLNLVVPSDRITVIVGPSGCGKTTTLRMVNRMLEPSKGKITWDDKSIKSRRKTTLRRQMGYVIQSGGLFPHRTVLENIATVPDLLRWDKQKSRKRAVELLDSVGLERKLGSRFPAQLSGGQQQRVGVARALAADPLVLLMDEPFSAVDPVVRAELHEFFLGLQRQLSKTIIMITHDVDEAIKLGDQVAILRVGGRLAQVGTPQQLLDEPADAFVEGFVGKDRGYRSLSFQPASGLTLGSVQVVRDAGYAGGEGPVLVVDADARPVGWADPSRPGAVIATGATFDPETDSLRAALDAALTSPVGLAIAVAGDRQRYAGVVDADMILRQVTQTRAEIAQSIAVRSHDQPETPVESAPVESVPVESGPVESGPVESAPVESGAVESGPVESGPVGSGPVESPPVESSPVETAPVGQPASYEDMDATSVRGVPPVETVGTVAAVGQVGQSGQVESGSEPDPDATRISGPLPEEEAPPTPEAVSELGGASVVDRPAPQESPPTPQSVSELGGASVVDRRASDEVPSTDDETVATAYHAQLPADDVLPEHEAQAAGEPAPAESDDHDREPR